MFKETKDGQTHYQNDGCGEIAHNDNPFNLSSSTPKGTKIVGASTHLPEDKYEEFRKQWGEIVTYWIEEGYKEIDKPLETLAENFWIGKIEQIEKECYVKGYKDGAGYISPESEKMILEKINLNNK